MTENKENRRAEETISQNNAGKEGEFLRKENEEKD
jgi:hypothetical protein